MPTCTTCLSWYALRSRIPGTCRECEAREIQRLAREPDPRALHIGELAGWVQSGRAPVTHTPVWRIGWQ